MPVKQLITGLILHKKFDLTIVCNHKKFFGRLSLLHVWCKEDSQLFKKVNTYLVPSNLNNIFLLQNGENDLESFHDIWEHHYACQLEDEIDLLEITSKDLLMMIIFDKNVESNKFNLYIKRDIDNIKQLKLNKSINETKNKQIKKMIKLCKHYCNTICLIKKIYKRIFNEIKQYKNELENDNQENNNDNLPSLEPEPMSNDDIKNSESQNNIF